ncbi:ankyrin repeat domain-containing protein [Aspergillus brunneoviolaceus CBS 621.78]|uniref:Ankyrin n=1 Tax=Aspergillus brunneoviolaceus CBS 621.78 TaxID=1450534 RepID=A0ACD1G1K0_9EURO|nr:ankyrin [Aspergillus brunneoviolaceus CBS 621.78]RAH43152.1 ankyrin [Aspergillus brunneoviolaceus CBS 621.78]
MSRCSSHIIPVEQWWHCKIPVNVHRRLCYTTPTQPPCYLAWSRPTQAFLPEIIARKLPRRWRAHNRLTGAQDTLKPNGRIKGRFLATARHGDHFGKFSPGNVTCLEIEASRGDVESFLDGNVTYLPEFLQGKPELWKYIRHQIIESAGGISLLVRLYYTLLLDEKNLKGVRALGQKLHSKSGVYDHAYGETMKRIEQQSAVSQDLAKRALAWIAFSARPLSAVELQDAIAVEIGAPELDETNVTGIDDIASVCCGLVVADKHANTTRMVHLTAQEYLNRTWQTWFPDMHEYLTNTCLTYASFEDFDERRQAVPRPEYPFYSYAAHELRTHLRHSLGKYSLLMTFLENDLKVSRCMCEMFGLEAGLKSPGIHLVALLGLEDHVPKFIFRPGTKWADARADARDHLGRTPLIWAAAQGNSSVVSTLLGIQADINAETLEGFTPLFYAAAYGHAEMVTMLINWGVYIHSQTRSKETALFAAARGGAGV